jgi:hypothetical protein
MRKGILKRFTTMAFIVAIPLAGAVTRVHAQTPRKVVADVPFEFSVGYKTMPAGGYIVETLASAGNALLIQNADAKSSALRGSEATVPMKDRHHARLVFRRYGERYFLAEVWSGLDVSGRQLVKSQEERAIEKEFANLATNGNSAPAAYEVVELVAILR